MESNRMVKVALLTAGMMTIFGGVAMSPALPGIRNHFAEMENIDYLVRFVLTLTAFFIASSAPVAGYLVDRIGRRKILISSLLLAGIAGTSSYFAPSLNWILAGRAFLGIAVAGIMTSATTLIADYHTGEERGRLLGLQTGLMGIGGTLMLTFVGMMSDAQWNSPFLLHLIALFVVPLVLIYVREPQRFARCQDDHPPAGEPGICAAEAELRESPSSLDPALPTQSAPIKLLAFIYFVVIFTQVNFFLVPLHLPFYLSDLLGASATQSGFAISFMALAYALSSIFLGKTLARQDRITVIIGALLILSLGYSLISLGAASILLYVGLVIGGIGLGIMIPSLYVWLANGVPAAFRGRALGGFTTATFLGQFLSPLLSQPLINTFSIGQTILMAGVLFAIFIPVLLLSRRQLRTLGAPA